MENKGESWGEVVERKNIIPNKRMSLFLLQLLPSSPKQQEQGLKWRELFTNPSKAAME